MHRDRLHGGGLAETHGHEEFGVGFCFLHAPGEEVHRFDHRHVGDDFAEADDEVVFLGV